MSYTKGEVLISLDRISLSFGEKLVLRDVSLKIEDIVATDTTRGQIVTLLGRSGVGKTQLFKMMAGLLKPSSGEVLIRGSAVTPGLVGMVLQNYPLFRHRTLGSNLHMAWRGDKSLVGAAVAQYLYDFDLLEHADKYPSQLSGGQRQRAAIIQQLFCSEHFILLDEPFSGLDPVAIDKLCASILKVASRNETNTVVISSHILEPSLAMSDSVYMLGYEDDESAQRKPGATIVRSFDLAAMGLAWDPEIRSNPAFHSLVEEIRETLKRS